MRREKVVEVETELYVEKINIKMKIETRNSANYREVVQEKKFFHEITKSYRAERSNVNSSMSSSIKFQSVKGFLLLIIISSEPFLTNCRLLREL